jgi:hypothetical protein
MGVARHPRHGDVYSSTMYPALPFWYRSLVAVAVSAVALVLLCWPRMSGPRRRMVALVCSGVGLVFLVLALQTEGQREAPTTTRFLLGEGFVSGQASASASLPFYVATAVCLLLGTVGLALPDESARRLDGHWLGVAVALALAVTAVRFLLERVAAPPNWTYPVGISWLGPPIGAFFLWRLREERRGLRGLLASLLIFALMARGAVAALMAASTFLRLGTHYDLSRLVRVRMPFAPDAVPFAPGSWEQVMLLAVLPQLTFWVVFTLLTGLAGAAIFSAASSLGGQRRLAAGMSELDVAPARDR